MLDSIISIIQNFGFPVACCVFLGYYLSRISSEYRDDVKAITDDYKDAIRSFQKTLDKNTSVLTELNAKLGTSGKDEPNE